jgi:single-stranded-DNA-specific exonuclease
MKQTEWILKDCDRSISESMAEELEIPIPVARILVGRNIKTASEAAEFIEKPLKLLRSPKNLPDVDKAVQRLKTAIETEEKIFVWGDYDVDGITSTAIVATCLKMFGANFIYKVPSRFADGYDIKRHSVDECVKEKCSLLMSVDCGIVAFDTAEYAKRQNIDIIITDHHSASEDGRIPDCVAVVNPSRKDSEYGFPGLCGASVAFKLMTHLGRALGADINKIVAENLELVALGTVADVAPMMDENRVLVAKGCELLSQSKKPGIQELLKIIGVKEVDTTTIGFGIGPRLNAIGRLADPMIVVELLLEQNSQRAKFLAQQTDAANKRRQLKQEHMLEEAVSIVQDQKLDEMPLIVCWAKSWHSGLIGLIAGKLAEKYQRPAIVLALGDDGKAKGSCRSTRTVNILNILKHKDALEFYGKKLDGSPIVGGHAFAAGMEVPESNLINFREQLCKIIVELNPEFAPGKIIYTADSRIVPGDINDQLFDSLQGLAPFGSGHPEPVFWVRNLKVKEQKYLSGGKHLKLTLESDKLKFKKVPGLLWHKASDYSEDYTDKNVDILFSFGKESQNYGSKFYLNILDFKIS